MSPEQIAETEGYELTAVKSILYQCSAKFRESIKKDSALDFTDEQHEEALAAIAHIMRYSEDDRTRLRAALYLRDDKKGRLDNVTGLKALNINIMQINQHLIQVAERMASARSKSNGQLASTDKTALGNITEAEEVETI